jgi:hypothetical protein
VRTPLEVTIVQRALDLISNPERWTMGMEVRGKNHRNWTSVYAKDAVQFCAVGALKRCTHEVMGKVDRGVYGMIVNELHEMVRSQYRGIATSLQRLNDYRGDPDPTVRLTWEQRIQLNHPRILALLRAYLEKRTTNVGGGVECLASEA